MTSQLMNVNEEATKTVENIRTKSSLSNNFRHTRADLTVKVALRAQTRPEFTSILVSIWILRLSTPQKTASMALHMRALSYAMQIATAQLWPRYF